MLWHVSKLPLFQWQYSVIYVYHILFIHSLLDVLLNYFYALWLKLSMVWKYLFKTLLSVFGATFPEKELLGHMVTVLVFLCNHHTVSIGSVPFSMPSNSACTGFQLKCMFNSESISSSGWNFRNRLPGTL